MVYYTYYVLTGSDNAEVDFATSILYSLQPVLDPILMVLMLKELRDAIKGAMLCSVT